MGLKRFLAMVGLASALLGALTQAQAQEASGWIETDSLIGESKYMGGFTHYDHANPDAPKGGAVNLAAQGTFDSFNPYIIRGTPAAGFGAFGGGLIYDTLRDQAIDEPSTSHPLLSSVYSHPDDYSSAIYRLNPAARWHDGKPVTPDDVVFTFNFLSKNSQLYNAYYKNVTSAEVLNDTDIKFLFDEANNRELPKILGDMPVLPKHWWEGTDAKGNARDITQPTLEPPLGSGPYRIADFDAGNRITWELVEDYWAKELPVNKGRNNFGSITYTYFLDDTPIWEAFKKGGIEDYRVERRSARWAQDYNFPAVQSGEVLRKAFATTRPQPMQGFAMNMRRDRFKDRRVRQALSYLFDFESVNRLQLFDLRTRTDSFFEGGELAASGIPTGRELAALEKFRDQLPPELLTTPYVNSVGGTAEKNRANARIAAGLLREAGWSPKGGRWINDETGQAFAIEFLGASETAQIISGQFVEDLRQFGIDASLRIVDPAQYVARLEAFDFDMTTVVLAQSLSPGNEQRDFWSSEAAVNADSRNMSGIKDPVVDALVDEIIFAKDRDELIALTHALDRVLLWNYYYIPQWHSPSEWVAWRSKLAFQEPQPSYAGVDFQSWWIKPEAAQ